MDSVVEKNGNADSCKMSFEEREDITKQLDDALKMNSLRPRTKIWDSSEYRKKYFI